MRRQHNSIIIVKWDDARRGCQNLCVTSFMNGHNNFLKDICIISISQVCFSIEVKNQKTFCSVKRKERKISKMDLLEINWPFMSSEILRRSLRIKKKKVFLEMLFFKHFLMLMPEVLILAKKYIPLSNMHFS